MKTHTPDTGGLMDAAALLDNFFHPDARPCLRWLRDQTKKRTIPFIKIGHRVFFDPRKVRAALAEKFTVECR